MVAAVATVRITTSITEMKDIALKYFSEHPEAKTLVAKKGRFLFREEIRQSHHFEWNSKLQATVCWVCSETWNNPDLDYCSGFAKGHGLDKESGVSMPQHICNVLMSEYYLYEETIRKCETMVRKLYKSAKEATGEELAFLHTTHGCDPETFQAIMGEDIPREVYDKYRQCMEEEKALSRSAIKREVITAIT